MLLYTYVTWSKGMSRMSGILILSCRLKEVINSYVYFVFEVKELFISLEPDVWLRWDLDQNVAVELDKRFILKNQNWKLPTCDSFPLIVSHISLLAFQFLLYVMWSSKMSWNSQILFLRYSQTKPIVSFVSYCLFNPSTVCIFGTNCPIYVWFSPN